MSDETVEGTAARPVLRTLAGTVNWLTGQTHPTGRGHCANARGGRPDRADHGRASVAHHSVWSCGARGGQPADAYVGESSRGNLLS